MSVPRLTETSGANYRGGPRSGSRQKGSRVSLTDICLIIVEETSNRHGLPALAGHHEGSEDTHPPQSVFTELPSNALLMRRVVKGWWEGGWDTSSETVQRHSGV